MGHPGFLVAGDGLFCFCFNDRCGWLDFAEGDEAGLLLLAYHFFPPRQRVRKVLEENDLGLDFPASTGR